MSSLHAALVEARRVPATRTPVDRQVAALSLAAIVIAVWIIAHPFKGMTHDTVLYTLLALVRLDPGVFGGDLFVAHVSQDRFSIFSPLYAGLIDAVGLGRANILLYVAGQSLWLLAAWRLCRALLMRRLAIVALIGMALLPRFYGGQGVFTIAEGFVTPRLFAEGLVLLALPFALRRHWLAAAALLAGAAAFHPLMAAVGVGAVLLLAMSRGPRWRIAALALAGTVAFTLLALFEVGPFAALLRRFDAEWLHIVWHRSAYLFAGEWFFGDWAAAMATLGMLAAAARRLRGQRAALFGSVGIVAMSGWLLSLVATDLLANVFITQVQSWRALWLAQALLACACVALAAQRRQRAIGWPLAWLAPCIALPHYPIAAVAAVLALAALHSDRAAGWLARQRWLPVLLALAAGAERLVFDLKLPLSAQIAAAFPVELAAGMPPLTAPFVLLFLLLAAFLLKTRAAPALMRWGIVLLVFAATVADVRSDWQKMIGRSAPVATGLPADAEILWEASALEVWTLLGHRVFYAPHQGAAVVFSADLARNYLQRERSAGQATYVGYADGAYVLPQCDRVGRPVAYARIAALCASSPAPDAFVVPGVSGGPRALPLQRLPFAAAQPRLCSTATGGIDEVETRRFYLLRCADVSRSAR